MPADDLVLNVKQVAGYTVSGNAPTTASLLMQLAGIGSAYASISPAALVGTALAQGGDMAIGGQLDVASVQGGSAQFSNAAVGLFSAQKACITVFDAAFATVGGVAIATANDLATARAMSVTSFNMRFGDIMLSRDDILCAGGAPIVSPRFDGCPMAPTADPSNSSNLIATTAFVQTAIQATYAAYAPIDSPNFTGMPTAPTAAPGSSTGQIATTAFVMAAVAASTTGVSSFNSRTGAVVLTGADITSAGGALLASPAFTGVPTAPTAAPASSTTQLATTAFVMAAVAAVTAGVTSWNARTGAVTLTSADVAAVGVSSFNGRHGDVSLIGNDVSAAGGALIASPAFTGVPSAPTAIPATNTTQIATTAFVQAAVAAATSGVQSFNGRAGVVVLTVADVTGVGGALLASPTFTGTPAAPTAAPATSTTQLATCAFVMAAVAAATAGVSSFNSRTGAVTLIANDVSAAGGALLASPVFTGAPQAPTATPGTNTAQLATCAFVMAALPAVPVASTTTPLMNGTATAGVAGAWARGDHVHPVDASRFAVAGGTLTGSLTIAMATPQINLNAAAAGQTRSIFGSTAGSLRWQLNLGDGTAEGGSNAGSDFGLARCTDAGAFIDNAISIGRANGAVVMNDGVICGHTGFAGGFAVNNTAGVVFSVGGGLVAENATSPLYVNKIGANGLVMYILQAATACGSITVSGSNATQYNTTSDARLKTDQKTFDAGPILDAIEVYDFQWISNGERAHGVVAQEAVEVYPNAVTHVEEHDHWSVDYSKYVPLLINEIKALRARVAALEGGA